LVYIKFGKDLIIGTSTENYRDKKLTLKDYIGRPKKEWTDKDWLQEAHIMVHSPWISEEDREYWRDKINKLSKL